MRRKPGMVDRESLTPTSILNPSKHKPQINTKIKRAIYEHGAQRSKETRNIILIIDIKIVALFHMRQGY